jgi:hypothetical protein
VALCALSELAIGQVSESWSYLREMLDDQSLMPSVYGTASW